MECPKDRKATLVDGTLAQTLAVKCCPDCQGTWIPSEAYETWQGQQVASLEDALPKTLDVEFAQSPYDTKAALCPECRRYLSRAKVGVRAPFYIERCLDCGGIWCDRGEWAALEQMGLHKTIQHLFSSDWQVRVREKEYAMAEQQATIEKLGPELAARVFELAAALQDHPNGDFGVAYLMRRFDKPVPETPRPKL